MRRRVTVVVRSVCLPVCLLSHILLRKCLVVLKIPSRIQRAMEKKPLRCGDPVLPPLKVIPETDTKRELVSKAIRIHVVGLFLE